MMGPAIGVGLDKLRMVTQDIGGGFGNKITSHPQLVACCLLARKLNRPCSGPSRAPTSTSRCRTATSAGSRTSRSPSRPTATMLGFRCKALDDAGAYLRYEPLGGAIWVQVSPGMYRWRNIRVEYSQVVTNKAPVSPNRGYSRMQHLWLTERIIDIVAARARPRPDRDPQAQLRPARADAVRDAERRHLRLRRLPARARRRARADRLRRARGAPRRRRGARQAARLRHRLDARLGHEQLRPVAVPQPGAAVLGQQRGRDGQARHLRRGRGHARHDAAGPGPRDDDRAGRRRTSSAARPTTSTCASGTTRTGTRTRASRARTRASSRSRASARSRARPTASRCRCASSPRSCSAPTPDDIELAGGFARLRANHEVALPFMALGAIVNVNNASLPEDFDADDERAATSTARTSSRSTSSASSAT